MTARDTVMTIRRPSPQPNGVLAGAVLRGSTKIVALLALSVALIGAFVAIELRSQPPLVPFRIFRFRTLTGANVGRHPARGVAVLAVLLHLPPAFCVTSPYRVIEVRR